MKDNSPQITGFILLWDNCDKKKGKNLAYNCFNSDTCQESRCGTDTQKLQLPLVQDLIVSAHLHCPQPLLDIPQRGNGIKINIT